MQAASVPFLGKVLVPQQKEYALPRRRLLDQLHRGLQHRVTTIWAPAGYGKSTLAASFAADAGIPACWYTLDVTDRDGRGFLEYLVAALRVRFPGLGKGLDGALYGEGALPVSRLIGALVTEIYEEVREPFLLVFDDAGYQNWLREQAAFSAQ